MSGTALKTIICKDCGAVIERTGVAQKRCSACATARAIERNVIKNAVAKAAKIAERAERASGSGAPLRVTVKTLYNTYMLRCSPEAREAAWKAGQAARALYLTQQLAARPWATALSAIAGTKKSKAERKAERDAYAKQQQAERDAYAKQRQLKRMARSEQLGQDAYCLSRNWPLKKQLNPGVDYKHDYELLNVEFILSGVLELKDVDYYPEDAIAESREYKIVFLGKPPNERAKKSLLRAGVNYEVFSQSELDKWLQIVLGEITRTA